MIRLQFKTISRGVITMDENNNLLNSKSQIATSNAALMIIDMQKIGMTMVPTVKDIIPTTKTILNGWRKTDLPIIFKLRIQRASGIDVEKFRIPLFQKKPFLVEGTPEAEVFQELTPRDDEFIVKGSRFSGFFQTDLQLVLTRLGIKTLVICGVQTPNCIRATVMDALAYDYNVIVLSDAVTAQTPEIHEANLLDMKNMGTTIMTSGELLKNLS